MSVIANRHNVLPFVAGTSKPFQNQRLAKVGYKSTKANPAKYPSICVSVPVIESWTESQNQRLLPYFKNLLNDTQDKVIRSLYESSQGSLSNVSDEDISIDQCIAYLDAEETGDRLTKERIAEWFDSCLRDNLTVVIAEKIGTEDISDVRIAQHLAGYRSLFASLSKDSGALQEKQIRGLRTALEVTESDDEISKKLAAKLDSMLNRPKMEDLLELA